MSREAINKRKQREQQKTKGGGAGGSRRLKYKRSGRKETWGGKTERNREGEGKWSMELHLSQLATAGVLGEKGESVHPH